jgi:hypothetical protein
MLFVKFVVQFIHLLRGPGQRLSPHGRDVVDSPLTARNSFAGRLQQAIALQSMQKRIKSTGSNPIAVMPQLLHHGQSKNRLLCGMHQYMDADQTKIKFALLFQHSMNITLPVVSRIC